MGLSAIKSAFERRAQQGQGCLMPFVTAGDPTLEMTQRLLVALDQSGADLIEVGFPFSDPIADGPTISAAMARALGHGVTVQAILEMVAGLRSSLTCPLLAMASASIVYRNGATDFLGEVAEAGFDGVIVPDLDLSQAASLRAICDDADLGLVLLAAATTNPERLEVITRCSSGFIYLLARTGLTGEQATAPDLEPSVRRLRAQTTTPIAAGFGISTPEHVAAVVQHADGAIVGSALTRLLAESDEPEEDARRFTAMLAEAAAGTA